MGDRYLFLDIDGVLNSSEAYVEQKDIAQTHVMCSKLVARLNHIIKETKLQKKINEREVDSCGFMKQFQLLSCWTGGENHPGI